MGRRADLARLRRVQNKTVRWITVEGMRAFRSDRSLKRLNWLDVGQIAAKAIAVTTAINIVRGGGEVSYQIKPPPLIKSDTLVTGMAKATIMTAMKMLHGGDQEELEQKLGKKDKMGTMRVIRVLKYECMDEEILEHKSKKVAKKDARGHGEGARGRKVRKSW